ncbi:hypothetical protein IBL26_15585 [Roseomonas aerophila]|uniref:DUF4384 domain-containing protein n=1 Tax=Teichococcus aerophilus TaxID=1224513 RepID=A0ABR7RNT1_9PROT|nr:hypothetical protein [Pseudoroseomonas aerophila]
MSPLPPLKQPVPDTRVEDLAQAVRSAAAAPHCAMLSAEARGERGRITGPVSREDAESVSASLRREGVPEDMVRLDLQLFTGPYCDIGRVLQPFLAAPGAGPQVRVDGANPLSQGDLLRLDITMPDAPSLLSLYYLTNDGNVVRLTVPEAQAAGARLRKGDPGPGFAGWVLDEPFGTDVLLAIASDRPVFPAGSPAIQSLDNWVREAGTAFRSLRNAGGRAEIRPLVIQVAPRR